jgi:hypothetical protein
MSNPFDDNTASDPFADPSEGDFFGGDAKKSVEGALLAFHVKSFNPDKPTVNSKPGISTPMVVASVYVLDGEHKDKSWQNTELYGGVVSQLTDNIGGWVIGRWIKGKPNPKFPNNPPWNIAKASPEDRALGKAWYDENVKQASAA